jgi:hypothetical protein
MSVDPSTYVAYAQTETDTANSFLLRLGLLAGSLVPPVIDPVFPAAPASPTITIPEPPSGNTIVWTAPGLPTAFSGTVTIDDILPAAFEDNPPDLTFGAVPTFNEIAPDAPGIDISFDLPDLVVDLPAPPSLLSLNVAPFDGITIPTLDVAIPELTIDTPSIREYVPGAQYTSALLTSLKARLQDISTTAAPVLPLTSRTRSGTAAGSVRRARCATAWTRSTATLSRWASPCRPASTTTAVSRRSPRVRRTTVAPAARS